MKSEKELAAVPLNEMVGLSLGSAAPDFELPDLSGNRQRLSGRIGRHVLLIFFDPDCSFCLEMVPRLASLSSDGADGRPATLVISRGAAERNRQLFDVHGIQPTVLLQEGMEVALAYQTSATPTGYLIDEEGFIASELALGMPALLALSGTPLPSDGDPNNAGLAEQPASEQNNGSLDQRDDSLANSRIARDGLKKGTTAPGFRLPRVDDGELSLDEYRGQKVLLVFSDPECGPCDLLAPRLEKLARRTPDIQVLMLSRGDREANRLKVEEHGLTFPVVLQKRWEISLLYAMFATPIAYLIDEQGIIAADLAAGADAILNLLISAAILSLLDARLIADTESGPERQTQELGMDASTQLN